MAQKNAGCPESNGSKSQPFYGNKEVSRITGPFAPYYDQPLTGCDEYPFTVIASCRSWVRGRTLLLCDDRSSQRRTHGRVAG